MTDYETLVGVARNSPLDDTPRLVLADWLDDHGRPFFAEFIRLQIAVEPVRTKLDDTRVREMLTREKELIARHADDWFLPDPHVPVPHSGYDPVFRRGLPESIAVDLRTLLEVGDEILGAFPTVREVAIYGVEGWSLGALAESSLLRRVDTWVMLDRWAGGEMHAYDRFFRALARSPARGYRQYGCPEGHLIHMMLHLAEPGSKVRIELVQLDDLDRPNATTPGGWDKYDEAARCFNDYCRERIADVVRPAAGPFPLRGVLNKYLVAGHTRRGQPALAGVTDSRHWLIALFDTEGRLVGDEQHSAPKGFRPRSRFLVDELRFSPGLIWVRPFRWEDALELGLWTSAFAAQFAVPFLDPWGRRVTGSDTHPGRAIRRWLADGRFGLRWEMSPFEFAGGNNGGVEPAEV